MKIIFNLKSFLQIALFGGILFVAGCSKERSAETTTPTGNSAYFLTGLLGNESVKISGPSNPYVDTVTIYVDSNGHQCTGGGAAEGVGQNQDSANLYRRTQYITSATWTSGTTSSPNSVVLASLQVLKKLSVRVYVAPIPAPASTTLYSLLTPGNVPIADNNDPDDGVVISIRDSKGVLWTSLGEQTGSIFQINSTGANMGTYAIVTGTVNAKMYDGQGNVKQLTSTAFNAMVGL